MVQFKDKHCSYCGEFFGIDPNIYPKKCFICGKETYQPAPAVGIALVPINDGLLHVRRAIPPSVGGIALPGGYKNIHETWEAGIEREVMEETGIKCKVIELAGVKTANNGCVLVFGLCEHLIIPDPIPFILDHETQEAFVLNEYQELCFPHHTTMSKWFWARQEMHKNFLAVQED